MADTAASLLIALVEDQPLMRTLTATRLTELYEAHPSGPRQVRAFPSVTELLLAGIHPTIVLLDLQLEGDALEGPAAIRACRARGWPVLVLSGLHTREALDGALAAGAGGFISKDVTDSADIAEGIAQVLAGNVYVHPLLLTRIEAATRRALTPRQCEVLRLEALGRTMGQISRELGLTQPGVRRHIEAIVATHPDCAKQADRVRLALRLGLVSPWEIHQALRPD